MAGYGRTARPTPRAAMLRTNERLVIIDLSPYGQDFEWRGLCHVRFTSSCPPRPPTLGSAREESAMRTMTARFATIGMLVAAFTLGYVCASVTTPRASAQLPQ